MNFPQGTMSPHLQANFNQMKLKIYPFAPVANPESIKKTFFVIIVVQD